MWGRNCEGIKGDSLYYWPTGGKSLTRLATDTGLVRTESVCRVPHTFAGFCERVGSTMVLERMDTEGTFENPIQPKEG
jgi:hypothetical protein